MRALLRVCLFRLRIREGVESPGACEAIGRRSAR